MKRILIAAAVMTLGLMGAAVVYGATTNEVTTKGSKKAGTKKKPATFKGSFHWTGSDDAGGRISPTETWKYSWEGVRTNGKHFPACTPEEIDQAQSDAGCPRGSFLGSAPLVVRIGPESDRSSYVTCRKTVMYYNGGRNRLAALPVGPAEECAGIGYLPPITERLSTRKGTTTHRITFPEYATNPLPGLEAAITDFGLTYKNATVKVSGKTIPFMQSTRCKGKRNFSLTIGTREGTSTVKATAGTCRQR